MNVHRQRLTTLDKAALGDDDKTLAEVGVKEGDVVQIKDLGPQICKYSTLFVFPSTADPGWISLQRGGLLYVPRALRPETFLPVGRRTDSSSASHPTANSFSPNT